MTEKLKNKINDEQLKIRAISDEKITVKLNICTFFLNSITGISFKVEKIYNAI